MQHFLAQAAGDMDPVAFWTGAIFAALLGGWLLRQGRNALWRLRLIVDTPTARIRSAPQGYVELRGRAAPLRGLLTARLTGKPCVWYRWRIEQYKQSGRSGRWVLLEHGSAECAFLVDDGTGAAEVLPAGAYLHCRTRERWTGPRPFAPAGAGEHGLTAFIGRHRRWRMTEERIALDEPVYILGHFETPRRGVRERETLTRTLLAQWKRDPARMRRFDRNGDGEIDLAEWEHARREAAELAERAEARLAAEPPRPRVGPTGDPDHPFVVSTEDEPALLRKLRLTAFGGLTIGALACVGAALMLLARLMR
jgi:hypothetical protein